MRAHGSRQTTRRPARSAFTAASAAAALCVLSLASTSSSLVAAQYPSNNTACTRQYTVEAGDTCDIIGQKTWTSTYQIMALNLPDAGPNCYGLEEGTQLCLGRYGNDCQFVHRARDYDTCESIAGHWDISTTHLLANNPTLNCDQIYDGLMLCVSKGLIRPPADASLVASGQAVQQGQMPLGQAITPKVVASSSSSASSASTSAGSSSMTSSASLSSSVSSSVVSATGQARYNAGHHRRGSQFQHH